MKTKEEIKNEYLTLCLRTDSELDSLQEEVMFIQNPENHMTKKDIEFKKLRARNVAQRCRNEYKNLEGILSEWEAIHEHEEDKSNWSDYGSYKHFMQMMLKTIELVLSKNADIIA